MQQRLYFSIQQYCLPYAHNCNLHSNNYAQKFTSIYTLNLSSKTFYDILKKKQEEKSHDILKFTTNYSKHDCDVEEKSYDLQKLTPNAVKTIVTSQAQILTQQNNVSRKL